MEPLELKTTTDVPAEVLATLAEIAQEINTSLNLDEVLAKAAAHIKRLIDYEIFAVLLPEEGTNQLYFRFAIGHRPEVVEHWRIPIGEGITGGAAATGRAALVSDVRRDARYLNALDAVRSELAVPLLVQGKVIGVLDIQSRQLDYFTRDQQNILTLIASRIAGAIENARLFERLQHQADTLLVLNEVGREAGALLEVEAVLRRSAELVKRVIDYQIFSILLYDENDKVFRHRVNVKFGQQVQEKHAVSAHEGIVGAAATLGRAIVVPDVTLDPRYLPVNPETRSELAVPLIYKSRVVGVMDLESPQLNYFTPDHVQALSILGANLAVSIENARLYEQVAKDEARMERDLSAARRLQGALLPPVPGPEYGLDIAARYISARELCGDIYDFLRYGPSELGVVLGDVSGKGSAAALYGAVAVGILRSLGPQKLRPAEVLGTLNRLIGERRIEGRFMTMCFATWHRAKRRVRIANAGQEQPFLCHGGTCEKVKLVGFPLGMFEEATAYDEAVFTLDPGDALVFHSDGFGDTADAEGRVFGTERLRQVVASVAALSASDIADRLIAAVEEYSGGAPAMDDRTLVVLKAL
ncbi:MAG TPA: GAF domain-containing SpoIIE family protein phosphatase [Candidatus Acidoferrales bacterium]|jgi:sigma-B regulation protein RsbU (phosphoserine phosphatase)|nr:GAF domain-containing SpoIIE family protein phosphatase [Candidatus Acidoferrales bacterium]